MGRRKKECCNQKSELRERVCTGASYTGKTILEKYHFSYLAIDYLKMGLIRSGYTNLTLEDDGKGKTNL